jgi:methionyl-tRNA formyltransferase
MRIVFAGTPPFALTSLQACAQAGFNVVAVYTQPDRPAGRGRHLKASPVKTWADERKLPIEQPLSLKDPDAQAKLAAYQPDVMVVAAYGLLLPQAVLDIPKYGCLNVHASLLPRWRGAAPINHAILAGDKETGVTIMQMTAGLDEGPMIAKSLCPIQATDTAASLYGKLALMGGDILVTVLKKLDADGVASAVEQDSTKVTYASKLQKNDGLLDWTRSAVELDRQVRGLTPWPMTFTHCQGEQLRVHQACLVDDETHDAPGTIIDVDKAGIKVATGDGVLMLEAIQWPGKKAMAVSEALNASRDKLTVGSQLG